VLKAAFDVDDEDAAGWEEEPSTFGIQTVKRIIDITRLILIVQALHLHSYAYNRERLNRFQKMVHRESKKVASLTTNEYIRRFYLSTTAGTLWGHDQKFSFGF